MAGDQYWDAYFPATRDQLLAMQGPEGAWHGDGIGEVYGTSIADHHPSASLQVPSDLPAIESRNAILKDKSTDDIDLAELEELNKAYAAIREQMSRQIVGQNEVVDQLLIAVFARGHCILEGVPGLAKTLDGAIAGPVARARLQPDPVHARLDAQRHHRHRGALRRPRQRRPRAAVRDRARSSPT